MVMIYVLFVVTCVVQLLIFSIPLTLYLARCLDLVTIHYHRDGVETRLPGRLRPLIWLLDHCFFLVLIAFQVRRPPPTCISTGTPASVYLY